MILVYAVKGSKVSVSEVLVEVVKRSDLFESMVF